MFDLFKRSKEPLHVTRQTVFDNESIPAAAIDGDFERRIAALEILGRSIEPRVNDLVDIHKKEIAVHHANEVARKARIDAESATRISSGTIDAHELNITNIGEQLVGLADNSNLVADLLKVITAIFEARLAGKSVVVLSDFEMELSKIAGLVATLGINCSIQNKYSTGNLVSQQLVITLNDVGQKGESK